MILQTVLKPLEREIQAWSLVRPVIVGRAGARVGVTGGAIAGS